MASSLGFPGPLSRWTQRQRRRREVDRQQMVDREAKIGTAAQNARHEQLLRVRGSAVNLESRSPCVRYSHTLGALLMRKRKAKEDQFTDLCIKVDDWKAWVGEAVNYHIRMRDPGWDVSNEPVYRPDSSVEVVGTCLAPADRAGHQFELRIVEDISLKHSLRLKDIQEEDEHDAPRYREHRGRRIAIYKDPLGMALIDRRRGESVWHSWVFVESALVTKWLLLLTTSSKLYVGARERKVERSRWLQSLSLQTRDPRDE